MTPAPLLVWLLAQYLVLAAWYVVRREWTPALYWVGASCIMTAVWRWR